MTENRKFNVTLDKKRLKLAIKIAAEEFGIEIGTSAFLRTLIEMFLAQYVKVKSLDDYEFKPEDKEWKN